MVYVEEYFSAQSSSLDSWLPNSRGYHQLSYLKQGLSRSPGSATEQIDVGRLNHLFTQGFRSLISSDEVS